MILDIKSNMKIFDYPVPLVVIGGFLAALPIELLNIIGLLIIIIVFIKVIYD